MIPTKLSKWTIISIFQAVFALATLPSLVESCRTTQADVDLAEIESAEKLAMNEQKLREIQLIQDHAERQNTMMTESCKLPRRLVREHGEHTIVFGCVD